MPGRRHPLTPREVQVLEFVAQGMTNREIGAELSISPETVKTHIKWACIKLGARGRTKAVVAAIQTGQIGVGE